MKEFQNVSSSLGCPQPPVECVEARHFANCTTPTTEWLKGSFEIPLLEDLEFVNDTANVSSTSLLYGGEDEGLRHFNSYLDQVIEFRF